MPEEKTPEKISEELLEKESDKSIKKVEEQKVEEVKKEERPSGGRNFRGRKRKTEAEQIQEVLAVWKPKTKLGEEVRKGKIKDLDEILDSGRKILESEIVDTLIKVRSDLIAIGQSKGKFGGGKRRAWRQTQRKTREGNIATFSTIAVVGDEKGHIGIGTGKAKETLPARDKAVRKAKLEIFKIKRACAGFDCACSELHSIPFKVTGKSGSVRITLIPAPQGTGLVVANELKKILKLAGIKDVYSQTFGKKRTTFNLIKACIDALKKTNKK